VAEEERDTVLTGPLALAPFAPGTTVEEEIGAEEAAGTNTADEAGTADVDRTDDEAALVKVIVDGGTSATDDEDAWQPTVTVWVTVITVVAGAVIAEDGAVETPEGVTVTVTTAVLGRPVSVTGWVPLAESSTIVAVAWDGRETLAEAEVAIVLTVVWLTRTEVEDGESVAEEEALTVGVAIVAGTSATGKVTPIWRPKSRR
jgi:hypothetical protein